MKPWFNALVVASLVLGQFAAPLFVRSAPALQEGELKPPLFTYFLKPQFGFHKE